MPAAPASVAVRSSSSTTCGAVRLGKASRSKATAPAICGAEKLVPEKTKTEREPSALVTTLSVPFSYVQHTRSPRAARKALAALVAPALLLKFEITLAELTEPAMITLPLPAPKMPAAIGSGLAGSIPASVESPSLPAEITTTTPLLAALMIAARNTALGGEPPSERLITLAPAATAALTPAAMLLSEKVQPLSGSGSAQVPTVSPRNIRIVELKAKPTIPVLSRAAAATIATLVP